MEITPGVGELSFSSFAPVLSLEIIPPSYDLTGSKFAPEVVQAIFILPGNDDLVFSFFVPEIFRFNTIFPLSLNLVFSSFAPNLVQTTSASLAPPSHNLIIDEKVPNFLIWYNPPNAGAGGGYAPSTVFTSSQDRSPIVTAIIELYIDGSGTEFLLLSSGSFGGRAIVTVLGEYDPRLFLPVEVGMNISTGASGLPTRGVPRTGNLEFALDETVWKYLRYNWNGRNIEIYEGVSGDLAADLHNTYTGQVFDLTFSAEEQRIGVKITDRSYKFDKPLIPDLYSNSENIDSLNGKPKPYLRGECFNVEPVLENEVTQFYRLSWGENLTEIIEVRVGGVPWDQDFSYPPAPGKWWVDLAGGYFHLGSPTLGQEVRVDVKAGSWTSMELMRQIIIDFGGTVDESGCEDFELWTPFEIGFYTKEQVNILDVLDEICISNAAYWEFAPPFGYFKVQRLALPNSDLTYRHSPMIVLNNGNVVSLSLSEILPPAKKITLGYRRNWQPNTTVLPGVDDDDKVNMMAEEFTYLAYENTSIDATEARSVEIPTIRTLYGHLIYILQLGIRFAELLHQEKRIYEVNCWLDVVPELYDTVYVDYQMIGGYFRIHSIVRRIGGGFTTLRLWGDKNVRSSLPDTPGGNESAFELEDEDGFILLEGGDDYLLIE